jgi:ArsR family transcriptional regulator
MPTELVQIFKALADETRFNLLNLLLTHDWCVGALARHMGVSEAAVSQHLRALREAGLVRGEKRGYWTHYTVERGRLQGLAGMIAALTDLPPCSEGLCLKNLDQPQNGHKEEEKMCDCKCQHPEKLKGKPEECTPKQIKTCHGDRQDHPCEEKKEPKK